MSQNTKNFQKLGGAEWYIGGKLTIGTGAAFILPTADPHIAGALWNNSGTITVSAG